MSQDPYKVYRTIARVGGVVLLLLGVLVLLGWLWKIELFTTFLSGRITMKPNTAIGFLFLGLAFFLLTSYSKGRKTQLWCAASATVVILVGLLTLSEYLFHVDLGIDQLLFKDLVQMPYPGRMAHITAFNFCIVGLSVLLLALSEKRAKHFTGACGHYRSEFDLRDHRIPVRCARAVRLDRVHLDGPPHRRRIPGGFAFGAVLSPGPGPDVGADQSLSGWLAGPETAAGSGVCSRCAGSGVHP